MKGGTVIEAAAKVTQLAFDKTGTPTHGPPVVTDLLPAVGVTEAELVAIAAAVEAAPQRGGCDAAHEKPDLENAIDEGLADIELRGDVGREDGKGVIERTVAHDLRDPEHGDDRGGALPSGRALQAPPRASSLLAASFRSL